MRRPLIERRTRRTAREARQRGVTMAMVALSLVALISMAALSIDLGSLYEAKAEAQRAADLGALAAARIISLEGLTGDSTAGPADVAWRAVCGSASSPASVAAINVAQQNLINGSAASTVTVNYGTTGSFTSDCSAATGTGFTVNPEVQVYVQQASLPSFFSRIFSLVVTGGTSNSGVSATATAEIFNPSGSGSLSSGMVPAQPKCVKPLIVPNSDPENYANPFLNTNGSIVNPGISPLGQGVIGESFILKSACSSGSATSCNPPPANNPPKSTSGGPGSAGSLQYVPATVTGTPIAVASNASCSSLNAGSTYQLAIAGCDQSTVYACGTPNAVTPNLLGENPVYPNAASGDTATAVQCLINSTVTPDGPDILAGPPTAPTYPFAIQAGNGNPLVQAGVASYNDIVTTSNNIVTLPIYDSNPSIPLTPASQVTILGFLQVFIENIDTTTGNLTVTVLNVTGCSNDAASGTSANGTSPVPIRLITP
ncbi:MAG: pilus assembly protein TadG-related protein [Candidatus Sulfotelmatobacter sp.]